MLKDRTYREVSQGGTRPERVVYCAENPVAALLEILVHSEIEVRDLPARYKLLKITAPDDARIQRITTGGSAPDWQADMQARRALGDAWLREMSTPLLAAPSAIARLTATVRRSDKCLPTEGMARVKAAKRRRRREALTRAMRSAK